MMNTSVSRKQKLDVKILSKFTVENSPTQTLHSNANERQSGWEWSRRGRLGVGAHQHQALHTTGAAGAVGSLYVTHILQRTHRTELVGNLWGGEGAAAGGWTGNQKWWGKHHHTSHYRGI